MKYVLRSINSEQIFTLDVTQEFSENHKATITSHPVELGSPINDHIYMDNPALSIRGIITDYDAGSQNMIDLSGFESSMFQDVVNLVKSVADITTGGDLLGIEAPPNNSRSIEFGKALKLCMYQGHIFSLIVRDEKSGDILDHFNTVAIEDLKFRRSVGAGSGMIEVDIQLKQVRTARIRRTEISNAEKEAVDKSVDKQLKANATKNASSGSTGTTKSGSKTDKSKSIASSADPSAAFNSGAEQGASGGRDRLGEATARARAAGSEIAVNRKDIQNKAAQAQAKHFGN